MHAAPIEMPPARADRHVIFALLSFSLLTFIMQFGMVSVSLGELTEDLNAPLRWSGWVLTIFMIGQLIALPAAGRLSERFGARLIFAGGLGVFSAASLACALAPNVYVLILARLVQGAAGGGMMPAGSSLIAEAYGEGRMRAIGYFSSLIPFGAVLGPVLGGLIVEQFGWRWTFGLNVPLGLIPCVLGFIVLPRGQLRPVQRIDFAGIGLIALTITALVFALTELGQRTVTPDYRLVAGAGVLFLAGLLVLVRHESRTLLPVVDLDLLRRSEFLSTNVLMLFFGMTWIGVTSMIPLYGQEAYGLSVGESGALIAPRSVVMMAFSALAAWALPHTGYRKPIALGILGTCASMALLAQGIHEPSIGGLQIGNLPWLIGLIALGGAFFGMANPAVINAGLDLAPDRIAAIAGLRNMFMTLGGTLGISIAVLIASRADTTGGGLEIAFSLFVVLLLISTVLVIRVPQMGQRLSEPVRPPMAPPSPPVAPRAAEPAGDRR